MTRKSINLDSGLIWKNNNIVYVVSYSDKKQSKTERIVTAFNNLGEAKRFYLYCLKRYAFVQLDTCRLYDGYTIKKLEDVIKEE